jgi:hypothetical protein
MRGRSFWAGLALALMVLAPAGAQAQRGDDWYREIEPWLGRGAHGDVRKGRLMEQYFQLRSDVRRADRSGAISPRTADTLYGRLDKVARFLRDDRSLSNKEYNRRRDDLDKVARGLERAGGARVGRGRERYW